MSSKITMRTYNKYSKGHSHKYHQIVLPTKGYIDLILDGEICTIAYGDCIIIRSGCYHEFKAREDFRFLVIDIYELPDFLSHIQSTVIRLDESANTFVRYIEKQLEVDSIEELEESILSLLFAILAKQDLGNKIDYRIKKVIQYINQDLSKNYSIEDLSAVACLSHTQFKVVFRKNMGQTPFKYLTKLRMENARVLLNNTDLPISIISEKVGFTCQSSFTRCFSNHFSQSPKHYRAKR
ncbi:helix-turn-helix domain-containing protein [Vibrio parahaemolyticus]|nr:helix-turn-helix domain-containing protein [Vibrio parahaemolyticus]